MALFLSIVPLSALAAMGVWAFAEDRDARFLLLMLCLAPAVLGLLVLTGYGLLRQRLRPSDVVRAVSAGPRPVGPPPALPRTVPGTVGWRWLSGLYCTSLTAWAVGFWFVSAAYPDRSGRLLSDGRLWMWGGAITVIVLCCVLNVDGTVGRVLPDRTRALRGTVRDGGVVAADGGLRVTVRVLRIPSRQLAQGLRDRDLWLCWDPRRGRRVFPADGAERHDCAAVLVLDNDRAVRVRAVFPPGTSAWEAGTVTGGPEAPVDPARKVGTWDPRTMWPLTVTWPAIGWYALALLMSGAMMTEGAPRGLLGVVGTVAMLVAFALHSTEVFLRAPAAAWYRDAGYADAALHALGRAGERASPETDRLRRVVRRIPVLLGVVTVAPAAALAGLLAWVVWPGPQARSAVVAGCLAVAGLVWVVLLVHRVFTGPVETAEAERALRDAGLVLPRDSARRHRLRRAGALLGTVGTVGWLAGLVLLLPAGDVTADPRLEVLRDAGAVVAEVPILSARRVKSHYSVHDGRPTGHRYAVTQSLTVGLRDDTGLTHPARVTTKSDDPRAEGDRISVIYAPSAPAIGAYIGEDSSDSLTSWLSNWQGYQADLPRLLDGRALSGRQLVLCGTLWFLAVLPFAFSAPQDRGKPKRRPVWPVTLTFPTAVGYALVLAGSAVMLTDWVTGFGRVVLGVATGVCLIAALTPGPLRGMDTR
ncbi:hypothetical protein GCM10022384_11910 [Streptomyces marokkonensis]|uniref:Integral membrane protein n=1 Tax=Streptomyces marokkonensis TaxID=324855 RepID=A0ABP7P7D9_9ACTN